MNIQKIYVGGWFQRTTLHLSEIYDFLRTGKSPLELSEQTLARKLRDLNIVDVEFVKGDLDSVVFVSRLGVTIHLYEDGLIVLSANPIGQSVEAVREEIEALTGYYEKNLSPAISYLFSLGAPIPKELANVRTIYPYFVVLNKAQQKDINALMTAFDQEKHFEIHDSKFEIYRGDKLYIINNKHEKVSNIEKFVGEQIFMREFRTQLHRYLNLHRIIWERIATVKEKGEMRGRDIRPFKSQVERYYKTINLIETRINQMGLYVRTREAIAKNNKALNSFQSILGYRYDTLTDTLEYVKEIWKMTKNYVQSALDLFTDLQAKSTESSVKSLTIVTSMGVGATLIGLFTKKFPEFTTFGFLYFLILLLVGYFANRILKSVASNRTYEIKDTGIDTNIT